MQETSASGYYLSPRHSAPAVPLTVSAPDLSLNLQPPLPGLSRHLAWRGQPWRDRDIEIRIQRKTLLAIIATVLLHLLLLWLISQQVQPLGAGAEPSRQAPIELSMGLSDFPPPSDAPDTPASAPRHAISTRKPQPEKTAPPLPPSDKAIREAEPAPVAPPQPQAEPSPPAPAPAVDLATYMQQQRERRQAAERAANGDDAPPQSDAERRLANIQRNLQKPGTNGLFQIVSKGTLSAQFMFKGWTGQNMGNARSQMFEVSVPPGGDIERAIVQRMIVLIRTHYSGDFNWESPRLGRTTVLSARPEDNAGLEAFLLREFFGTNG